MFDTDHPDRWQGFKAVFFALCLFGFGLFEYQDLARWELAGGTKRMNAYLIPVYEVTGKYGVLLALWVLGGVYLHVARRHLMPAGLPSMGFASGGRYNPSQVADEGE